MTEVPAQEPAREIVCPHCKKTFTAELMAGQTERHRGFKCPHCRLFVPAADPYLYWLLAAPVLAILPAAVISIRRAYRP